MKKTLILALAILISGLAGLAAENENKPAAPRRENLLEKYDKNKNGKLDQDEREALRKDREAERIKRYDKNGDGKLDEKERESARSEFRQRRTENQAPKSVPSKESPAKDAPAKDDKKKDPAGAGPAK